MKKYLIVSFFIMLLGCSSIVSAYTWTTPEIVSSESMSDAYRTSIVCDNQDGIHVVWKDNSDIINAGDDWDLFYSYKPYQKPWYTQKLITPDSSDSITCLCLAVDSENMLHLAWKQQTKNISDTDIYYMSKAIDEAWSSPLLISVNSTNYCSCPSITVDSDDSVHLIWTDNSPLNNSGSDTDMFYTKKTKQGDWMAIELMSTTSDTNTNDPFIVTDKNNNVHIVWYEQISSQENSDIYYSNRLADNTWSLPILVSENCPGTSFDPTIKLDVNDDIHILWNDDSNIFDNGAEFDIFYRNKPKYEPWNDIELVSAMSHSNCKWPTMEVVNTTIYAAWSDNTPYYKPDSDYDICLTSKNEDDTWNEVEIVSMDSTDESNWPRFVFDKDGQIHMTWWDRTPSKWVVYYSMGTDNNVITNNTPISISITIIGILFITIILYQRKMKRN